MSVYEDLVASLVEAVRMSLPRIKVEELEFDEVITDADYPNIGNVSVGFDG